MKAKCMDFTHRAALDCWNNGFCANDTNIYKCYPTHGYNAICMFLIIFTLVFCEILNIWIPPSWGHPYGIMVPLKQKCTKEWSHGKRQRHHLPTWTWHFWGFHAFVEYAQDPHIYMIHDIYFVMLSGEIPSCYSFMSFSWTPPNLAYVSDT